MRHFASVRKSQGKEYGFLSELLSFLFANFI